jgi:hypothetical protein
MNEKSIAGAILIMMACTLPTFLLESPSMSQTDSKADDEAWTVPWTVLGFKHFMSGPQLKAASAAVEAFTKEFTSWNIENYSLGIKETPDVFDVWLNPNLDPENYSRDHIAYGQNKFGKEVHYTISKGDYKVIRMRFGPG